MSTLIYMGANIQFSLDAFKERIVDKDNLVPGDPK
jgi:hypothetical protein